MAENSNAVNKQIIFEWGTEILSEIYEILKHGNDVEIKSCKDGYKVLEVERKRALTIKSEN